MLKFYLFEAGATKTTFIKVLETGTEEMILPPFNANRDYSDFEKAVNDKLDIELNSKIVFYGSGCSGEENKEKVRRLFKAKTPENLEVHDDIIAAARSVFGKQVGIIGILGTGGLAAYYDGTQISQRRGGYGYLLGDLGGGLELGKKFLALWLNGDLSKRANDILSDELDVSAKTFVEEFYINPDFSLVSHMTTYALQFEDEPVVKEMLQRYFDDYVFSTIIPICKLQEIISFSTIGSVGFLFRSYLEKAALNAGLNLEQTIQDPTKNLVEFHRKLA